MIDPQVTDSHDLKITPRLLRQFAGLWLAIFLALAAWEYLGRDHTTSAAVFAVLALAFGPAGLIKPQWIRPLFALLMAIATPIGWLVSTIVLSVLFYGIFTPLALVFRLMGRDALVRRAPPRGATYWTPKPIVDDPRRYFRQY
ncbi:MAG: SxtJ family membrane protein [Pirellulales bacterium]